MPELPEVETVVRGLRIHGVEGTQIVGALVRVPQTVLPNTVEAFESAICGRRILSVSRRAKYLVFRLEGGCAMLIHLRMTGRLYMVPAGSPADAHERLRLELGDGRAVSFRDARRFGRCWCVADPDRALRHLGPEPLSDDFSPAVLKRCLQGRRRKLKPLLLDQRVIAGLGNIYVDESLWEARIHPEQQSDRLTNAEVLRLHNAIRSVLLRAVEAQGTTLGDGRANFYSVAGRRGENSRNLRVFRRDGQPCPRCGHMISRSRVGQRGTHLCLRCQPIRKAFR